MLSTFLDHFVPKGNSNGEQRTPLQDKAEGSVDQLNMSLDDAEQVSPQNDQSTRLSQAHEVERHGHDPIPGHENDTHQLEVTFAATTAEPESLPTAPMSSTRIFAHMHFNLRALSDADSRTDLINAITLYGGNTDKSDKLSSETTHILLESTTDITSVLLDTHDDENMALTELIQEALLRGIPVITDTYIWQCILSKDVLDPESFEVVRLDKDGQFIITKGRPNLRRSASEPTAGTENVDRPMKPQARPELRTALRPTIKRFHSYHPNGNRRPVTSSSEEDEVIIPSRRGSAISPGPRIDIKFDPGSPQSSGDTLDVGPTRQRRPSSSDAPGTPKQGRVYIYSSPKADKPKFLNVLLNGKKGVANSGSDSGSELVAKSSLAMPRKLPKPSSRKRPHVNNSFHKENYVVSRDRANRSSEDDGDSVHVSLQRGNGEQVNLRGKGPEERRRDRLTKGGSPSRNQTPPPISPRPILERHNTPLQRRNSGTRGVDVSVLPGNKERAQWQTMLASVLTGEVIRSEKRRITGTLTQKQQLDQQYQIWLGIRAYLRGRSVPEERQRIDERRVDAEATIDEVLRFEVQATSEKSPYDQVVEILNRVDKMESLYPTRKALILDKPLYAGLPFQHKVEALNSWLTISNSLRLQLQVLKNWTGSEDLLTSRSQHPLSPDKRIDTSFIERILKESGVKRTFLEIRIMSVLRGLLAKCKASMIENASAFKKMQLPTYINELQQLASFPSNLMEEILKVRLEYTEKLATHSGVMLDQIIEDFGVSLSLAIRIKHECQELDTQAEGWSIANSLSPSYDVILLKSLKYYFTLLNWRLKSSTDTVFFKEAELLENEWNFMSAICFYIDGGDVETAVQFCELEAELLGKVLIYLDNALRGVGDGQNGEATNAQLTSSGMVRWYARMLDNVRSRARKLLRFQKTLTKEFENSAEYTVSDPYPVLMRNLLATGHALVRTDTYANQGVYIFASPSLNNRPECVAKLLKATFAKYDNFQDSIGDGYILLFAPKDRLRTAGMSWQGRSMQVRLGKGAGPIQLKSERVRLIADNNERLGVCKAIFEGTISCDVTVVKPHRAHVESVHEALKAVKSKLVELSEGIIGSVAKVRVVLSRVTAGGGSPGVIGGIIASGQHGGSSPTTLAPPGQNVEAVISAADLVEDMFSFASDFGWRSLKYIGNGKKHRTMMKRLVGLAVEWVDFCAADCCVGACPPTMQQKAFKWSLMALEFAMTATSGGRVYVLSDGDFGELRMGVARCMRVLIRGFEQGGGTGVLNVEDVLGAVLAGGGGIDRSKLQLPVPSDPASSVSPGAKTGEDPSAPVQGQRPEISALRNASDTDSDHDEPKTGNENESKENGEAAPAKTTEKVDVPPKINEPTDGLPSAPQPAAQDMQSKEAPRSDTKPASSPEPSAPAPASSNNTRSSHGAYHGDTFLQRKQKAWLARIEKLEEERMARQQGSRVVGKVLDSRNVVDRNISFLASTSSSISLRWQQGKFLGGGSFGSVSIG
ncbi:uncharacterized protein SPPG_08380 [Spizellomyces punctatus DAOM BR117]|uniref:BRCT domain-containing protein n=1 Tax=Spizellomyces punctatus (strain DAOM BR117) TaxID=645134 RepID=A0A0L0H4U5_SPIPD|nr:uncharacterized protein SPPG_08380 [Spizellomyces punctatus DAOM BR117]KNC96227.1 hypothetical protein SPPG_08380 [Spizellomyces punctatus DAOM BR117]|eukprot:XP_016604267.1 hypothetical protein SPPG_08380 [Spizellomyces punctatus DAOM BR117]